MKEQCWLVDLSFSSSMLCKQQNKCSCMREMSRVLLTGAGLLDNLGGLLLSLEEGLDTC